MVAYDAGNAVVRAWRLVGDELQPLWRRDGFAHAGHLILYPDTRELVVQDWRDARLLRAPAVRRALRPALRVLAQSAARGARRCRAAATSSSCSTSTPARTRHASRCPRPRQAFLFPAPGFGRDVYYQSLTTIARVAVR